MYLLPETLCVVVLVAISDFEGLRRTFTPRGGDSNMKGAGMLVVSLRGGGGVNFVFWSHLGCSGQNAIVFSRQGLARSFRIARDDD